jgi:hypothetical protein
MIRTITSEWIKLRTVLVHWVLAIIAAAFPIVITVLAAALGDYDFPSDLSGDISGLVVGTGVVTAMLLGAMAAISLTSEYGHNTIRPTFAATPARLQVHTAKLVVVTAVVVTITSALFYGLLRLRVPAEVALVVLAAVAISELTSRRRVAA